jgi:hypothetical protein
MSNKVGEKHRYTDLTVDEISIVDKPANEKEFAVIKSVDDNDIERKMEMAKPDEEKVQKKEEQPSDSKKDEVKKVDDGGSTEQVLQAISKLQKDVDEMINSQKSEDNEVEKSSNAKKDFEKSLKAAGFTGDNLKKALACWQDTNAACAAPAKKDDVSKSETEEVEKAKVITARRVGAIKAAYEQLKSLLAGLEEIPSDESPNINVPSNTKFGDSGIVSVTKEIDELKKKIDSLVEVTKTKTSEIEEKVSKIEKAAIAPKSLPDSEAQAVVKKNDFWQGVL